MEIITKETKMEFAYNPQIIKTNHKVSVDIANKSVEDAIRLIFNDLYTFVIVGKYIILTSEKEIFMRNEIKKNFDYGSGGMRIDSCLINKRVDSFVLKKLEPEKSLDTTIHQNNNKMLKKIVSSIASTALIITPAVASDITSALRLPTSAANVSFVYPLGTHGKYSKDRQFGFSLNLLSGITGGVNGVELGGLYNRNKQYVKGVQVAGILNYTGGFSKGLQMGGVNNTVKKTSNVQLAGIFNNTVELNDGLQAGGIFNIAGKSSGAQIAGVFNCAKTSSAVQLAGIMNLTKEGNKIQISGILNNAQTSTTQISLLNIAGNTGFQMGLVNISGSDDAVMLGLLNFAKKGGLVEIGLSTGDYIYGAANLITGTDRLYSIISLGMHTSALSIGTGVGTRISLNPSKKDGIHLELVHNNFYRIDFKDTNLDAWLEQFRIFYSKRINRLTLYGGPTVNVLLRDADFTKAKDPLYSILNNRGTKRNFDLWAGIEAGIRFNLKK
jgi:hypothetical protein